VLIYDLIIIMDKKILVEDFEIDLTDLIG